MSHVSTVDLEVKDLDALEAAAEELGLELVREQKNYRWFGTFGGDYNDPAVRALGIPIADYGRCEHLLRVKGKPGAYEIGLARNPKGEGYVLLFDFWNGGYGLMEKISAKGKGGKDAGLLAQAYAREVAERDLRRKGFRVTRTVENGKIKLKATRAAKVSTRR